MLYGINCTQYEVNEREYNQTEAAHIVTGATKFVLVDSFIHQTGLETLLNRRRKKHKLLLFYKCKITYFLITCLLLYRRLLETPLIIRYETLKLTTCTCKFSKLL